jgi:hypothetical protein
VYTCDQNRARSTLFSVAIPTVHDPPAMVVFHVVGEVLDEETHPLNRATSMAAQGIVDTIVNISESEQANLTFDRMTAPDEQRTAWLGMEFDNGPVGNEHTGLSKVLSTGPGLSASPYSRYVRADSHDAARDDESCGHFEHNPACDRA